MKISQNKYFLFAYCTSLEARDALRAWVTYSKLVGSVTVKLARVSRRAIADFRACSYPDTI